MLQNTPPGLRDTPDTPTPSTRMDYIWPRRLGNEKVDRLKTCTALEETHGREAGVLLLRRLARLV